MGAPRRARDGRVRVRRVLLAVGVTPSPKAGEAAARLGVIASPLLRVMAPTPLMVPTSAVRTALPPGPADPDKISGGWRRPRNRGQPIFPPGPLVMRFRKHPTPCTSEPVHL